MKTKVLAPLVDAVRVLPDIFNLVPNTDYNRYISHSVSELNKKAADLHQQQMKEALISTRKRLPEIC